MHMLVKSNLKAIKNLYLQVREVKVSNQQEIGILMKEHNY